MRARRYGSASARNVTAPMPRPTRPRGGASARPPATSTANTTMASTMAEPRSGSFITSAGSSASTSITGRTTRRQSCELAAAPAHEVGGVEQERELGDLGRLEAEHARAEPAARPRHVDADAGDEHDDEQDRR